MEQARYLNCPECSGWGEWLASDYSRMVPCHVCGGRRRLCDDAVGPSGSPAAGAVPGGRPLLAQESLGPGPTTPHPASGRLVRKLVRRVVNASRQMAVICFKPNVTLSCFRRANNTGCALHKLT